MKQREQWRSRAGRGLSLFELTITNGFCWNRLWHTQEREMELLCSLKSLCMERLDKELRNGPESQGSSQSSSSSHAKSSSTGDIPATFCKGTARRAASIQKSRGTRPLLGLAGSGPLQVPFQEVVHSTLTGTDTKKLGAHSEMRSLLQE